MSYADGVRMQEDYRAFLDAKAVVYTGAGLTASVLPTALYDWQAAVVAWALAKGRAGLFCDCGLGKTAMQLAWADQVSRHVGGRVLILAPLAVAAQTAREGEKFGLPVTVCRTAEDVRDGINVTNYERLHHFNSASFVGLVLDECFAPGTVVDVVNIDGQFTTAYIQDIRVGDTILNAAGVDLVSDVHRRPVPYAVAVTAGGVRSVCSPNHPYFTRRGWVGAQDLVPGDAVMATSEAVRMVRARLPESYHESAILRAILLSEMADASAGDPGEGAFAGSRGEAWRGESGMVQSGFAECVGADRTDSSAQPDERSQSAREGLPRIESDAASTFRAWGQRAWFDDASTDLTGCARVELDGGIQCVVGPTSSRLSHALQDRHRRTQFTNRYRSGWRLPLQPEGARSEEGRDVAFARVDCLEVLEQGHPELEQWRAADGYVYFYDLGGTRHPSFSIAGRLVHNSSILKSFGGSTRKAITDFASGMDYRLACTATPAPNDLIELTNHAEFLNVLSGREIIALFFTQDGNTTHAWRLKGHAHQPFYRWLSTWTVAVRRPSDLGYDDGLFHLPPLTTHQVTVDDVSVLSTRLFASDSLTLEERRLARRSSLVPRVQAAARLVLAEPEEPWIVWCDLNAESQALTRAIPGAVEVTGSDDMETKEARLLAFSRGEIRVLVSKPTIAGHGLNWQHCARMVFVGLSDSWEAYYQAVRRAWRFGQTRPVEVYVIASETEGAVVRNIQRKEHNAGAMMDALVQEMAIYQEVTQTVKQEMTVTTDIATGDGWTLYLGDAVAEIDKIASDSVGLSIFSPPFPGMYAYSNSAHDIGNTDSLTRMIEHFRFLVARDKLYRVMMPGRLACVHLMQLTAMQNRDGYIGVKDYRGAVIQMFQEEGWIYAGEVTIDKNPQVQAVRNKERGLLFKTLATDSSLMRMALADYLIYFRKPGANPSPIHAGISQKYNPGCGWITEQEWIEWAAPVWYRARAGVPGGIQETDVLNVSVARESDDERHLCPLQLGVIERAVKLWSAPGDLVCSPFAGIGSEGVEAIRLNRRFVGIELKASYWQTAARNLRHAETLRAQGTLFEEV